MSTVDINTNEIKAFSEAESAAFDKALTVCGHYVNITGVPLLLADGYGRKLFCCGDSRGFDCVNKVCSVLGINEKYISEYIKASHFAKKFGGRYIFQSCLGFTHFISPVILAGEPEAFIVSAPIVIDDKDYFFTNDIEEILLQYAQDISEIKALYKCVLEITPKMLHSLCEELFINTVYIASDNRLKNILDIEESYESHKLQSVISSYITKLKKAEKAESNGLYPLNIEDELLFAMTKGDKKAATALLNQILSHIFFYSGFNINIIRLRVIELMTLLSRAAVKGGADMELVLGLNYNYLNEVDKLATIEDLAYWLSVVMNRYMEYVFNFVAIKHADMIYKAIQYINMNYMNKLTLESAAQYVYLSPAYFSKVFKDEMKCTFNTYLNKVRIERAKKLLLNDNVNLSDISNIVGYEDQSYFTKVFKKNTGMSPGKFRQSRGINHN